MTKKFLIAAVTFVGALSACSNASKSGGDTSGGEAQHHTPGNSLPGNGQGGTPGSSLPPSQPRNLGNGSQYFCDTTVKADFVEFVGVQEHQRYASDFRYRVATEANGVVLYISKAGRLLAAIPLSYERPAYGGGTSTSESFSNGSAYSVRFRPKLGSFADNEDGSIADRLVRGLGRNPDEHWEAYVVHVLRQDPTSGLQDRNAIRQIISADLQCRRIRAAGR